MDYWVSGLCPSFSILKEDHLSEIESFPVLESKGGEAPTQIGLLEGDNLNHCACFVLSEYWPMGKVQKPSKPKCNASSAELFRIEMSAVCVSLRPCGLFNDAFSIEVRRDSSVGIATGWTAGVRFPAGARNFSVLHSVQIGSGAHPASSPMGAGGSPRG
jgi:hypothetical protein